MSTDRSKGAAVSQQLIVHEIGQLPPEIDSAGARRLQYQFVDQFPSDGFSAWEAAESEEFKSVDIAEHCRALDGGFRQQALNRYLAQEILRSNPCVIVVCGLWGCTLDLPRIAEIFGVPCIFLLRGGFEGHAVDKPTVRTWLGNSLSACHTLVDCGSVPSVKDALSELSDKPLMPLAALPAVLQSLATNASQERDFSYSTYEFALRDHPLLVAMQEPDIQHFKGHDSVLDVGCGAGIFLDCLRRAGINAKGVERDPLVAAYGSEMGLDITSQDAISYLELVAERFDGAYCSHFVEHLPIEAIQALLRGLWRCLKPGGMLVLVFPDPESIRSQLLGFWRDPEHTRFYHPELIASMAAVQGFQPIWSSYDDAPHPVSSFVATPPEMPVSASLPAFPKSSEEEVPGLAARLLESVGLVSRRRLQSLEDRIEEWSDALALESHRHLAVRENLEDRTEQLWAVNQTWAWNDNVTLKFRKGADRE